MVVSDIVEWADFDTNRAAMVGQKIGETFFIIEHGNQPVFLVDGGVVEGGRRAIANTAAT
jgi:hypothetical protein